MGSGLPWWQHQGSPYGDAAFSYLLGGKEKLQSLCEPEIECVPTVSRSIQCSRQLMHWT